MHTHTHTTHTRARARTRAHTMSLEYKFSRHILHCCLINRTTKCYGSILDVRMPILSCFYLGVNDSCRRFRTTLGPVANVNSRGCNVNLDRIARGMFPSALYSSRNHDNCRRVTVSSAALGQLVWSRFRVYSKRDERKGEKEPAEA